MNTERLAGLLGETKLIRSAIEWANHSAGDGLGYADPTKPDPDEFLLEYSASTGDENWDTIAERVSERFATLLSRLAALEEALKPFAVAADNLDQDARDKDDLWESPEAMMLTVGDLRTAQSLRDESLGCSCGEVAGEDPNCARHGGATLAQAVAGEKL